MLPGGQLIPTPGRSLLLATKFYHLPCAGLLLVGRCGSGRDSVLLELESKFFGVRSLMVPNLIPPHRQTVDLYGVGFFSSEKMVFLEITLTLDFLNSEKMVFLGFSACILPNVIFFCQYLSNLWFLRLMVPPWTPPPPPSDI